MGHLAQPSAAVRVVVDIPADLVLDYAVPEEFVGLISVGSEASVPLGRRKARAFVVQMLTSSSRSLRFLLEVVRPEPLFHSNLVDLISWVSHYYFCPFARVFRSALPALVRRSVKWRREQMVELLVSPEQALSEAEAIRKRARAQSELLSFLSGQKGPQLARELLRRVPAGGQSLNALSRKRLIKVYYREPPLGGLDASGIVPTSPLILTPEQQQVFDRISNVLAQTRFEVFLIHGITGSGKTEIYLQLIQKTMASGRQAIVLVPEISLTPQMGERFCSRLGNKVAIIHSRLSGGERNRQWKRIISGEAEVVLGPRSAVFAPVPRLGLIVVDEEHETSYKQRDQAPYYHARDTAVMRAKIEGAVAVLGSATPSLESYYNSRVGKYTLLHLRHRPEQALLPQVAIIDMRRERERTGAGFLFSQHLVDEVRSTLADGHQVILFLNRRGFTTLLICRDCGYTARCRHCSISLTYHRSRQSLLCHLCGYEAMPWNTCPLCRSKAVLVAGTGTEKVEERISKLFSGAKVRRMDTDAVAGKGEHSRIIEDLKLGKVDILVGTKMIAKGLDYPNITLVGVLLADRALNLPDFRAGEYTFQVLTQVAGRSGRGEIPGKVVIQTLVPSHPAISAAAKQNFETFYRQEIGFRKELGYPPFNHLILVTALSRNERKSFKAVEFIAGRLGPRLPPGSELLGPSIPPTERCRGRWRRQIVIKTKSVLKVIPALAGVLDQTRRDRSCRIEVDVDPVSML